MVYKPRLNFMETDSLFCVFWEMFFWKYINKKEKLDVNEYIVMLYVKKKKGTKK